MMNRFDYLFLKSPLKLLEQFYLNLALRFLGWSTLEILYDRSATTDCTLLNIGPYGKMNESSFFKTTNMNGPPKQQT
jgi:hypothetical protein